MTQRFEQYRIFIAHTTDEAELALELKKLIEQSFLRKVVVSLQGLIESNGQKWLDEATRELKNCCALLILGSPKSARESWILYAAGAGAVRGIPVMALCHSGTQPASLPVPLNLLPAAVLTDIAGLKAIFPMLAQSVGCNAPHIDFTDFVEKVKLLEMNYQFWESINKAFAEMAASHVTLPLALKDDKVFTLEITERQYHEMEAMLGVLVFNKTVSFRRDERTPVKLETMTAAYTLTRGENYAKITTDPNFKWR